jgi:hypothetical protein
MSPMGLTGDGILMAQKVGAALWHMWLIHGGYGFMVPDVPISIRHTFAGFRKDDRPMPWIAVDRFGRRFMDEYPLAPQDTPFRALDYYDPDIQDYPRIPAYLIFDDQGRQLGPVAEPKINDERFELTWSQDNLAEVDKGWIKRADTLEGLAEQLGVPSEALIESVERWNDNCELGTDRDYHRPKGTMMPLQTPPFYAIEAWPIITNTQGGLVHNARQQVVDPYGEPIPRLYKAGELGPSSATSTCWPAIFRSASLAAAWRGCTRPGRRRSSSRSLTLVRRRQCRGLVGGGRRGPGWWR